MIALIASLTPQALAVDLSPMPIAALMLLLLSNRAKANSIAFLLGWLIGLFGSVAIYAFVFSAETQLDGGSAFKSILDGVLGLVLLFFAIKQWRMRPKAGQEAKTPGWFAAVESFSPWKAFLIALLLITVNAKNTIVDIAVGASIGKAVNSINEGVILVSVYTVLASLTILVPVLAFVLMGGRLNKLLSEVKVWLIDNNATILFVLFLVLGVDLLSKAFK